MNMMQTLQDLIEEAKHRTAFWALIIFSVSCFLSNTSKSMWTNIPISILLVSSLRILINKVDFHRRVRSTHRQTYLSHLRKKHLFVDDPCLSTLPPPPSSKQKRKIASPLVEAAVDEFVDKILQEFIIDLWYSSVTPDREGPEQIRLIITEVIGEISARAREINLVDLLTRDMVDLIGNHLDLYRRNQSAIGMDVMGTLSCEEREEKLRHHLMASKELHPALISPECEYKVLQRLMGGVLAVVLSPTEAQCPLVRCFIRELLTSLVMQPVMNLASPGFINELIEQLFLTKVDDGSKEVNDDQSADVTSKHHDQSGAVGSTQGGQSTKGKILSTCNQPDIMVLSQGSHQEQGSPSISTYMNSPTHTCKEYHMHSCSADRATVLEAATQRSEVIPPKNLENMWSNGNDYNNNVDKPVKAGDSSAPAMRPSETSYSVPVRNSSKEMLTNNHESFAGTENKVMVQEIEGLNIDSQLNDGIKIGTQSSQDPKKGTSFGGEYLADKLERKTIAAANCKKKQFKRSISTSALKTQLDMEKTFMGGGGGSLSQKFCNPNSSWHKDNIVESPSGMVFCSEGLVHIPKLKCQVVGAYFEKLGSKSFAVYSIAVTDAEKNTWFVNRRYRNFERLHRHLKAIPNYTLHLPPKRYLSSSTTDSIVHQRCIKLDKYLQDLLSIANVAEQHEVWDFLSASSKNYSFGKSTSVMRELAVNVDDAMDEIVHQFKGVSDGLMHIVDSSSLPASPLTESRNMSLNVDDINKHFSNRHSSNYNHMETSHCLSDNEESAKSIGHDHEEIDYKSEVNVWHSDNELSSKSSQLRVMQHYEDARGLSPERSQSSDVKSESFGPDGYHIAQTSVTFDSVEDLVGLQDKWAPPNVSLPLLNLVAKIFQLETRGWLSRQVFWFSKQILQLMMEDAIDDLVIRQIYWLQRDDIIAKGIHWVQDVLWPDGTFFLNNQGDDSQFNKKPEYSSNNLAGNRISEPGSFELQLEATRRASDVEKMILDGAPTALVSLIGHKQYRCCAKDIYYFLQASL
ncbi:PREDICTED: uncharacterized protein LOC104602073 isoform X1 [Nelumbo nucifera]|uniref:Uncharacterized protein LOC104602073 isoform X1 n=3 Tax=Nelumbo nucifera TaxID=4432 RepID=A0A1U8Q5J8_NELNU|nr:PREDICTED: uncharacterized protein LOC104602073 isoform X1 [Nelumbo nucifera]XP_019054078.1 PREDICTED: uncharacterized protein LOC104602073 isoform X1 [Nelumbo nucifera]